MDDRKKSLEECKQRLPLPQLWKALQLRGEPERSMQSPFRDDERNSFSVFQRDGRWFWRDHATDESGDEVDLIKMARGCDIGEAIKIYHELARVEQSRPSQSLATATRPKKPKPPRKRGKLVCVYDYHDEEGKLIHQTVRFENPKDFLQRRPLLPGEESNDGWKWTLEGIRTVLYRLPQVIGASPETPIFFVEGEKDANNLAALGLVATTVPMGANKWREDYTRMLEGKWVVVIGDNDEPGQKHVKRVVQELEQGPARLGVIYLEKIWEGCPAKGDISDWIEAQEDGADILAGMLTQWALAARDPREWVGCIRLTDNGPKLVHHTIAEAMIKRYQVRFAGEQWWRWTDTVWGSDPVQRRVRKDVATQLVDLPGGVELVTAASINAIEDLMMSYTAMHPDDFNQHDRALINCRNGMLNIETMDLQAHKPELFSTVQIPWTYNPSADCPGWKAWLEERLPEAEVRDLIQEMFGYCLAGNRINYHKFFFLYGDGGTGKSTVVDILTRMIGKENTVSLQLQELDNPFTRAMLVGKRLYLAKELTRDSLKHIGLVKAITSGDPINVEKKHKDGYSYYPQGRFVMESNVRANTPDSSDGFFRRLLQVTFRKKIKKDEMDFSLAEKLALEMEGIFFWALQGLKRLMERGHFAETADSREAAEQLEMHRASVKAFMDHCVELVDDMAFKISATSLFTTYNDWCEWEHVKPYYEEAGPFSRELLNRMPELRDRRERERSSEGRMIFYTGLKFRDWKTELGVKETQN